MGFLFPQTNALDKHSSELEVGKLLVACKEGSLEQVAEILQHDEDGVLIDSANATVDRPLIIAAWNGHGHIVELLLDQGAYIEATNNDGNNALHCAAYRGFPDVTRVLLRKGAGIDMTDSLTGKSALIKAVYAGRQPIVEQLLQCKADTGAVDKQGYTALAFAAAFVHTDILKVLLANGAKPNSQDCFGVTPLMHAASLGNGECVAALMQARASAEMVDDEEHSALDYADAAGHAVVVALLNKWNQHKHIATPPDTPRNGNMTARSMQLLGPVGIITPRLPQSTPRQQLALDSHRGRSNADYAGVETPRNTRTPRGDRQYPILNSTPEQAADTLGLTIDLEAEMTPRAHRVPNTPISPVTMKAVAADELHMACLALVNLSTMLSLGTVVDDTSYNPHM